MPPTVSTKSKGIIKKRHKTYKDIYSLPKEFVSLCINKYGDNAEKGSIELTFRTGESSYEELKTNLEKKNPGISLPEVSEDIKKNIKNVLTSWNRHQDYHAKNIPNKYYTFGDGIHQPFFIPYDNLPSTNPKKYTGNLESDFPGLVKTMSVSKVVPQKSWLETILDIFSKGNIDEGFLKELKYGENNYIYVLVDDEDEKKYTLYLAGPCKDNDCKQVYWREKDYEGKKGQIKKGQIKSIQFNHGNIYSGETIMSGEIVITSNGYELLVTVNNESGHFLPGDISEELKPIFRQICNEKLGCTNVTFEMHAGSKNRKKSNRKRTKRRKPRSKVKSNRSKTRRTIKRR